jgi:hypothetical protein
VHPGAKTGDHLQPGHPILLTDTDSRIDVAIGRRWIDKSGDDTT